MRENYDVFKFVFEMVAEKQQQKQQKVCVLRIHCSHIHIYTFNGLGIYVHSYVHVQWYVCTHAQPLSSVSFVPNDYNNKKAHSGNQTENKYQLDMKTIIAYPTIDEMFFI